MKKRYLLYFLVFILLFNMMIPVMAQNVNTLENKPGKEVLFMKELGFIDDEDLNQELTRGEFAVCAAKLFAENTDGGANVRYFKDVDPNSRIANSVHLLCEKGIVNGKGDGTFGTNEKISTYDGAVILLRIAGYSAYAEIEGYQSLIAKNDILKGVSGNTVTVENMAKMLFNILKTPVCVIKQYNAGTPEFDIDEDYLLMEKLFSMYEVRGILKGADGVCCEAGLSVSEKTAIIDNDIYEVADALADRMYYDLGCVVEAYVKVDEYGVETIVFYSVDDKTDKTEIMFSELTEPVDEELLIKYHQNGKIRTIKLPDNITVLKNGELFTNDVWEAFSGKQGVITILEDSEIFLVRISEYDSVLVSGINMEDKNIYAKYGKSINVDEDKLDRCRIYLADGSIGTLQDLKTGMFLTVTRGQNTVEIRVSGKIISGFAEAIDDESVTVNGVPYLIENAYLSEYKSDIEMGVYGTFYLNAYDEVSYFTKGENENEKYGVLVRVIDNEDEDAINLKIFTASGQMQVFKTVDRLNIDGVRYNSLQIENAFKSAGDGIASQLITYSVNDNGEIYAVDTKAENPNGTGLKVTGEKKERKWYATGKMMAPDIVLKENAVIFKTPPLEDIAYEDETKFSIVTQIAADQRIDCEGYSTQNTGFYTDALLIPVEKLSSKITWSSYPLMVNKVYKVAGEDDEVETRVSLAGTTGTNAADKGIKEYKISEKFEIPEGFPYPVDYPGKKCVGVSEIGLGDLVMIATDQDKEIEHILMFYDYDNPDFTIADIAKYKNDPGSEARLVAGYAVDRDGKYVALSTEAYDGKIDEYAHFNGSSAVPVVIFDSSLRANSIYEGSISDVLTYNEAGENASVVIPYTYNSWARAIFVYKYGIEK